MSTTTQAVPPGPSSGMPAYQQYGAAELKAVFQRYMTLGVALSAAFNIFLILLALAAVLLNQKLSESHKTRVVVVPLQQLQAPPLSKQQVEQIKVAQQVAPPSVGIPVPVPDAQAPQETQLASAKEIEQAASSAGTGAGSGDIVIAAPAQEELPAAGAYVYRDDEPLLIKAYPVRYPDLAKSSGIEGKVTVNVLVGTDGHVVKAEIAQGVPVLNDAALEAVKQYIFKPALANNKPVAVWVAVPIAFRLSGN
ncbi:MAG: energy transducer TonB [Candidatus Eisenbacteria bacterium]|nr:energy transducer TonB [Candidatus Eisenbacteria bacterium]